MPYVVDLDHCLLKPWNPPEEHPYAVVGSLLEAWPTTPDPAASDVRVVGHRWSAPSSQCGAGSCWPLFFAVSDFLRTEGSDVGFPGSGGRGWLRLSGGAERCGGSQPITAPGA
ncbi:hypothetical protein GCM10023080_030570 [Streptomyces pseudoechinosporeus]